MKAQKAQIEFKSGEVIEGEFKISTPLAPTLEEALHPKSCSYSFKDIHRKYQIWSDGFPSREAAIEDFKRFGTITERDDDEQP